MSANMITVEVFVKVDAEGNYEVATEAERCAEAWAENYTDDGTPSRMIRVVLNVPAPRMVEVEATVPEESNTGTAVVR